MRVSCADRAERCDARRVSLAASVARPCCVRCCWMSSNRLCASMACTWLCWIWVRSCETSLGGVVGDERAELVTAEETPRRARVVVPRPEATWRLGRGAVELLGGVVELVSDVGQAGQKGKNDGEELLAGVSGLWEVDGVAWLPVDVEEEEGEAAAAAWCRLCAL